MSTTELAVFGVISIFVISFFVKFVSPAKKLQRSLKLAISSLEKTEQNTAPHKVAEIFANERTLLGLWKEFAKTLHEQNYCVPNPPHHTGQSWVSKSLILNCLPVMPYTSKIAPK